MTSQAIFYVAILGVMSAVSPALAEDWSPPTTQAIGHPVVISDQESDQMRLGLQGGILFLSGHSDCGSLFGDGEGNGDDGCEDRYAKGVTASVQAPRWHGFDLGVEAALQSVDLAPGSVTHLVLRGSAAYDLLEGRGQLAPFISLGLANADGATSLGVTGGLSAGYDFGPVAPFFTVEFEGALPLRVPSGFHGAATLYLSEANLGVAIPLNHEKSVVLTAAGTAGIMSLENGGGLTSGGWLGLQAAL